MTKKKTAIVRLLNLVAVDMMTDCEFWKSVGNTFPVKKNSPIAAKTPEAATVGEKR